MNRHLVLASGLLAAVTWSSEALALNSEIEVLNTLVQKQSVENRADTIVLAQNSATSSSQKDTELDFAITPTLEFALKYEGSKEFGDVTPDDLYGAALLIGLPANLSLILEFVHGEFESGAELDQATAQLALEY